MARTTPEMETRREQLLAQFEYLAEELDAQVFASGLVPPVLWNARPPTGEPSLLDMLLSLVERARSQDPRAFEPWIGQAFVAGDGPQDVDDPVAVLSAAAEGRRRLVRALEALPEEVWDRDVDGIDLGDVIYDRIQDDVALLRAVAERLFESGMR